MTKKVLSTDMLGETHLPSDLFTSTEGLNGLMETYPDLDYGAGVLDAEMLGEPKAPPSLPDGVVVSGLEEDPEIMFGSADYSGVAKEASLADLSWLEVSEQDPERLPASTSDTAIPELEEAWGVHRRTDGVRVTPNVDRDVAAYEASLEAAPSKKASLSKQERAHIIRHAWRRVTAGEPFAEVATEAAARLGHDASRARRAMQAIKDDAGLIGRVFVRAANYPNCASGRWTDTVKKQAHVARYLVAKEKCGGCAFAQNGRCAIFRKEIVASVPWEEALNHYAPALEATGRKVASDLEPKEALRRAFAATPVGMAQIGDARPTHRMPADQITEAEARRALAAAPAFKREVLDVPRAEAHRRIARWNAAGLLPSVDAKRLLKSEAAPGAVLRVATQIISAVKKADYSGGLNAGKMGYEATREAAYSELANAEDHARKATEFLQEEMARREAAVSPRAKLAEQLALWGKAGLLSAGDVERLGKSTALPQEVLRTAVRIISAVKKADYSGGLNAGKMGYEATREQALAELAHAENRSAKATEALKREMARRAFEASRAGKRIRDIERKAEQVKREIDKGLRGRRLVAHIMRTFREGDRGLAGEILDPYIRSKNALREEGGPTASYSGVENAPVESGISASAAWEQLRRVNPPAPIDLEHRQREAERRKLLGTLARWVRDGLLAKEDASRLANSDARPHEVLKVAAALAGRVRVAEYSGAVNVGTPEPEITAEEAWRRLEAAETKARAANEQVQREAERRAFMKTREGKRAATIQAKVAKVLQAIDRGVRGSALLNLIRKTIAADEVADASVLLDPVLKRTAALENMPAAPREYTGPVYEQAVQQKQASDAHPKEVSRLLRWARTKMTEGSAGRELDELLSARWASGIRTAASKALQALRGQHEGLSGHVYVDATAYASAQGTSGCEKGALRHRANAIPTILQMDRCGSCARRSFREDGTAVCQVYGKPLVASAPVEDPESYRNEMIRLADGTDADRIAALYANVYDPDEFKLGSVNELDDIPVLSDMPSGDEVGDILFGGMEW